MKNYISLFLLIILLSACSSIQEKKYEYINNPNYRVIFTTGLLANNTPQNNLDEISISESSIYIFVTWFRIPKTKYHYVCKIYDGSGLKICESEMVFRANTSGWDTWTRYKIKNNVDNPGIWKFEIYLDNKKVLEKELRVISENRF